MRSKPLPPHFVPLVVCIGDLESNPTRLGQHTNGMRISIDNNFDANLKLFHAGTKKENEEILTSGGRVFCMTALGENLEIALKNAYNSIPNVSFDGMFYRSDIGKKGLQND